MILLSTILLQSPLTKRDKIYILSLAVIYLVITCLSIWLIHTHTAHVKQSITQPLTAERGQWYVYIVPGEVSIIGKGRIPNNEY